MSRFAIRKQQYHANIDYAVESLRDNLSRGMRKMAAIRAVRSDPRVAGLDPMTIMLIIKVLMLIAQWYINKRLNPKTQQPPHSLLEISDDHFGDSDDTTDPNDDLDYFDEKGEEEASS